MKTTNCKSLENKMETKVNLKQKGYEVMDIISNCAHSNGCYYTKCKSNKEINNILRSYGFSTIEIKKAINDANYDAWDDAKNNAIDNNRKNHSFPYRMGKEYDYSAKCDGTILIEVDYEEINKLSTI